ncbi:MAG TPA: thioredoxin [Acidimicrobiaceae bacterium]|nr:thioredoxin [Acidimicrobiaceae bacterium]HCB37055.1 thioredoxin [Acidimicrobiaceae bacterium]
MAPHDNAPTLPDGLVAFVKRDCPTCELVAPVLGRLAEDAGMTVYTQDDAGFPAEVSAARRTHDADLSASWHHDIETVPTLLTVRDGVETGRTVGWKRADWRRLAGVDDLGDDLVEFRPGCGSLSADPEWADTLEGRFGAGVLTSRRVETARLEDTHEAMFDRGWSDGLPLVPPTPDRVRRMLAGTSRPPDDVVANVPPDLVDCTVEKAAVNAVMAGCRPEYLPVVLAATTAVCTDTFNMHGLLATTMPVGPVLVVNGPVARRIGMNTGINVLGQGNRANSTIGRAVQLIVRNVGGGRPGDVDRATLGQPGKVGFCFAEDEAGSPWLPLSSDFGVEPGTDTVTVFGGEAPRSVVDQLSREPESLSRTYAAALNAVHHPKLVLGFDAIVVVAPDHARVYADSGWSRERTAARINELTTRPGSELVRGAGGIAEGLPEGFAGAEVSKFRPGGLFLAHCGGGAGLFGAVIGGWVNGETGTMPVCEPIDPWA